MNPSTPQVIDDVTVVIPTLGRPQLEACLTSLREGTRWPYRLIVIDQGEDAACARWVDSLRLDGMNAQRVHQPVRGIAKAMNLALSLVQTPLVAVTHDDCRVAADWLERLVQVVKGHPGHLHTGRVDPEGNEPVPSVNTSLKPAIYRRRSIRGEMLFPANMGATMEVVRRIGRFDEDSRLAVAAEDNEWCYRALWIGIPVQYDPSYAVLHVAWRDAQARARTYERYASSQGTFYGKYLRRGHAFILLRIFRECVAGSVRWVRGHRLQDEEVKHQASVIFRKLLPAVWEGLINPGAAAPHLN